MEDSLRPDPAAGSRPERGGATDEAMVASSSQPRPWRPPPQRRRGGVQRQRRAHQRRSRALEEALAAMRPPPPPRSPSTRTDAALDSAPLLGGGTGGAAVVPRRAMREPSVLVREDAMEHLEKRQADWVYSRPLWRPPNHGCRISRLLMLLLRRRLLPFPTPSSSSASRLPAEPALRHAQEPVLHPHPPPSLRLSALTWIRLSRARSPRGIRQRRRLETTMGTARAELVDSRRFGVGERDNPVI